MDDKYKIGSGTIGNNDFNTSSGLGAPSPISGLDDQSSIKAAPVAVQSDKTTSGEPLATADSYLTETTYATPDFLNDPTLYNSEVPDFIQNNTSEGVITTFVPDEEKIKEEKKKIEELQNEVAQIQTEAPFTEVSYDYNTNLDQNLFTQNQYETVPVAVPVQTTTTETVRTFEDPLVNYPQNFSTDYSENVQTTYSEEKSSGMGSWLAAGCIAFICLILTLLTGVFLNNRFGGSIAGISDEDVEAQSVLLSDEIEAYFETIKSPYVYPESTGNQIYSAEPTPYWFEIRKKGGILLDKISRLQMRVDNIIGDRTLEPEDRMAKIDTFLSASKEYVEIHYKVSEMFVYMERGLNMISRDIEEKNGLLETILKIDDLRAGIQNIKGEISEHSKSTTELRKIKILDYYYEIFSNYGVKLAELRRALAAGNIRLTQQKLNELIKIYNEDQKYVEETRFYVDYTSLEGVKFVIGLKSQTA